MPTPSAAPGFKIPESVLVVVHTAELNVLLICRADTEADYWQSVTGSKDHIDEPFAQTAAREVLEETGVAIALLPGFRETNRYSPRRGISKQVVYFLARAKTDTTHPQPEEILEARFVPLAEATTLLTYAADRRLLQKAEQFAQLDG